MPTILKEHLAQLNIKSSLIDELARIHPLFAPTTDAAPTTDDQKLFTDFLLDSNYTLSQKQQTIHLMACTDADSLPPHATLTYQHRITCSYPSWDPAIAIKPLSNELSQVLSDLTRELCNASSCLERTVTQDDRIKYLSILTKLVDMDNNMSPLLTAMESHHSPNLSDENRIALVCELIQLNSQTWLSIARHWSRLFPSFSDDQMLMQQLCVALLKCAQDDPDRHSYQRYLPLRPVVDLFNTIMHSKTPADLRKQVFDTLINLFMNSQESSYTHKQGPENALLKMTRLCTVEHAFEILTYLSKLDHPGSLILSCLLFQNLLVDTHQQWHIFRKCEINYFIEIHAYKSRRVLADLLPRLYNDRHPTSAQARQLLLSERNRPTIQYWMAQYSPEEKNDLFAKILLKSPKVIMSERWPALLNYLAVDAWKDRLAHEFKAYAHCLGDEYTYYRMTRPIGYITLMQGESISSMPMPSLLHHLTAFESIVKKLHDQGILMTLYARCSPEHQYRLIEPLLHSDALDEKEKMHCLAQCMMNSPSPCMYAHNQLILRTLPIIEETLAQAVVRQSGLNDDVSQPTENRRIAATPSWLAAAKGMLAIVSKFDDKRAKADLSQLLQGAQIARSNNTIPSALNAINNGLLNGKISKNDARKQYENLNHSIALPVDAISVITGFLGANDLRHIPGIAIDRLAMGFIRSESKDAMAVETYTVGSSLSLFSSTRRKRHNAEDIVDDIDGQTTKRRRP